MKITKERLKELVKEVMTEESEYQAFFQKALDKAGKSIPDMNDDEKKAFFNKIDTAWGGKGEKNETLSGGQKELDVDGDGDIEGDDLADLRAGKKADESVNEAELPSATIPASIKSKLVMAIDKIKDTKLTYNQKIQVIGQVMDSLGIDKGEFNKMSSKLKGTMESSIKEESPCWKGYQQIGMKEKGGKQVPNCVPEGKVNEGVSPKDMDKIKSAVEAASSFMNVGAQLKAAGLRYIFATEPMAIYIVNPTPNTKVAIINKRYASKPDFVVGDIAVGIMEGIVNEDFKHLISVDTPTQVVSKPIAAQILALAKKGVRSKEIGLKMGFVGNQKAATDAFQKVKNQIYFSLDKRNETVTEALWPKSKLPQSFQFALAPELKKNFKGIFYSIGDDIYHNDKKVLSVDGDRDSVNSIIAKLKKIVK
jgi:hypothetical protein